MKTYAAIIPARGGSKGVPRKNVRPLLGHPLVEWSVKSALESRKLSQVYCSTDDKEIADAAERAGAQILWRPKELASDEATTIAVLCHHAQELVEVSDFVILQPTSPLRQNGLIDACLKSYEDGGFDNLATGYYCKYKEFGTHQNLRRQDYKGFFYDDGNIYILNRSLALQSRRFGDKICRQEIARINNFEIDDELDFYILEKLMEKYHCTAGGQP